MWVRQYKKRPVIIDACQLTPDNIEAVEAWCGGSIKGILLPREDRCIDIQTLEGEMRAIMYDYIICGVRGEFYPCKPYIFKLTYEEVLNEDK